MTKEIHPAGIIWSLAIFRSRKAKVVIKVSPFKSRMKPFDAGIKHRNPHPSPVTTPHGVREVLPANDSTHKPEFVPPCIPTPASCESINSPQSVAA